MAYVAVRGGKEAIEASIERLKFLRLRDNKSLDVGDIRAGMRALISQVMSEASMYSPDLAALAIKQAEGSPEEAVFILRAYRSTIPRLHYSIELNTLNMDVERRISAAFKDIPEGQILGASTDYTHRLLDFELLEENAAAINDWLCEYDRDYANPEPKKNIPKVIDYLREQGLIREMPFNMEEPKDVTMNAISFPTCRSERLQILTRGQTGAVTALGYASLRGFGGGALHPTVGELRVGSMEIHIPDPLGNDTQKAENEDSYYIGSIEITEVETLIPVSVGKGRGKAEVEFELGYGICFGQNETKAIAMSLLDQNLETGDERYPTHSEEFVLLHIDSVEATGFISHLKLPHYVTFQAKLDSLRKVKSGENS
ncbi:MAG: carbon-phosphorus lyase complex subunit PhnI [Spirochaetales bacterium]|nr:carbon-phosphorus lyase complex subunit PhnI [Spirochaetales bacterium]